MSEFELERYTRNRMRELRGETGAPCAEDPYVEAYTTHRIRELRLEHEMKQRDDTVNLMIPNHGSRFTGLKSQEV